MRPTTPTPSQDQASTTRYSAAELAEFSSIIRTKITASEAGLNLALATLSREGSNDICAGNKGFDEGNVAWDREELMLLVFRQRKFINELDLALQRIRTGTYGFCKVSGDRIPKDRLRAVPHTTLSIAVKQAGSATS